MLEMDDMVKLEDIFLSLQDDRGQYHWPFKLAFQQVMAHGVSVNKACIISRILLQGFIHCMNGITINVDSIDMPAPSTCKEWNLENAPLAWASAATRLARHASPTGFLHLQLDHGSCKQIGACVIFLWYLDRTTQKLRCLNLGPNELVSGKTAEVRAPLHAACWWCVRGGKHVGMQHANLSNTRKRMCVLWRHLACVPA